MVLLGKCDRSTIGEVNALFQRLPTVMQRCIAVERGKLSWLSRFYVLFFLILYLLLCQCILLLLSFTIRIESCCLDQYWWRTGGFCVGVAQPSAGDSLHAYMKYHSAPRLCRQGGAVLASLYDYITASNHHGFSTESRDRNEGGRRRKKRTSGGKPRWISRDKLGVCNQHHRDHFRQCCQAQSLAPLPVVFSQLPRSQAAKRERGEPQTPKFGSNTERGRRNGRGIELEPSQ